MHGSKHNRKTERGWVSQVNMTYGQQMQQNCRGHARYVAVMQVNHRQGIPFTSSIIALLPLVNSTTNPSFSPPTLHSMDCQPLFVNVHQERVRSRSKSARDAYRKLAPKVYVKQ